MSRFRLVRELAEATGRSLHSATRFVKQVGEGTARRALRSAEDGVTWRLPATVGVGTGGVLYWREQNVREAEAIADDSQNTMDALAEIMDSDDLTPEQKAYLAEQIAEGSVGNGDDDSSLFPGLPGLDGIEGTLIKVLVVVMILAFVMNYATAQLPQPQVQAGVA